MMKAYKVTNGVHWVEIPDADLRILCGCPADVVKHLKRKGFLVERTKNGVKYETGPNAILLSDSSIQNGSFANLAEFPVLQMLYKQGMLIPNHPNNTGAKPILIGLEDQVLAQSRYIHRGNYGLITLEEIIAAGVPEDQARQMMRLKLRFAFDQICKTEELVEFCVIDKDAVELRNHVFIHRKGLNVYEIYHNGEKVVVDLNLRSNEIYLSPYELKPQKIRREYFSVIHIGEGNGWDVRRPCMASLITFQGKYYLIDAGPGITFSLRALGLSVNEMEGIFHTHAHDDHFAGLTALVRADHRIKYFATPLVRRSVVKKLAALMSFNENDFERYFQISDLSFDQWNNINGLEVKPIFSPHPVETSVFFFRAFGQNGYKTYAHFADIPSFQVLREMITEDEQKSGISRKYFDTVTRTLRTPVDLKKVDVGGGLIHGDAKDFKGDGSHKIVLSHTDRPLTGEEKRIGAITRFGDQDVLIPARQDYTREFTLEYLRRYFPAIPIHELKMLMNSPVVLFKPGTTIIKKGEVNHSIYLILSGLIEFSDSDTGVKNTLSSNSLIGELSGLLHEESERTYCATSNVQSLKISSDLYREFMKRNNLFERFVQKYKIRHFLQSTWLFGEMVSFPIQNEIAQMMSKKIIPRGTELPISEEPSLYLVASGQIKIYSENKVIQNLRRGGFFGEESILYKTAPIFRAKTSERSVVYMIPGDIVEQIPVVQWKLLETFERRMKIFGAHFAFEWRDAYGVNIIKIDLQHKSLFKTIDQLYQFLPEQESETRILKQIDKIHESLKLHFDYEELLMEQYEYPNLAQQKKDHAQMLNEVLKFRQELPGKSRNSVLEFLDQIKELLIMHTLIEDKKYRAFFNERGVF